MILRTQGIVCVHIHIPPTSYVGLILCTAVATASCSTSEDTMKVLCYYCDRNSVYAAAAVYPHSTLKGTPDLQ